MSPHYKALIVVMCISTFAFLLAQPVFVRFMAREDFVRRRNTWLALTLTAFLAPDFWLYALVALALIGYSASRDRNPAALYACLLLVVPPVQKFIPTLGMVNELFPLDHFRLLSIAILAPAAHSLIRSKRNQSQVKVVRLFDALILLYFGLQVILTLPYESPTNTARRIFLYSLDALLPYYVFSRACTSPARIRDVMACLALTPLILAPIAVFEYLKGWLMYTGIADQWGEPMRSHIYFATVACAPRLPSVTPLPSVIRWRWPLVAGYTFDHGCSRASGRLQGSFFCARA